MRLHVRVQLPYSGPEMTVVREVVNVSKSKTKEGFDLRVGPVVNGIIYLRDGAPVHVAVDGFDEAGPAEERFAALISAGHGRFEFRPSVVDRPDTVNRSLGMLLLECARRADEGAR